MTNVNYDEGPHIFLLVGGFMSLLALPSLMWLIMGKTFSKRLDAIYLVIIIALLIPSSLGAAMILSNFR